VKSQLKRWDRLMHLTIKMHGVMRAFNQLPRGKLAKELMEKVDDKTKEQLKQARKNVFKCAQLLVTAEHSVTHSKKENVDTAMDDEEIQSSEDENSDAENDDDNILNEDEAEESDAEPDDYQQHFKLSAKNVTGANIELLAKALERSDKSNLKLRNTTLTKWDERTRITKKRSRNDFGAMESSIVKQIDKILADRNRLITRTQEKRSDLDRIDCEQDSTHDSEIFDDDDFYQSLLKEFIERKSAQTDDPVAMSRQWLEVQKLRQKRTKRKIVDTRASKGRKIRYVIIPKLVNFYPAMPEAVTWTHEKRNELFKSLFY
jgi:protein AATF/BFR2